VVKALEFLNLPKSGMQIVITGGGAFNKFLISELKERISTMNIKLVSISDEIINFKEAMLIALMGFLRRKRIPNVIKTVTGANRDTIGGCEYVY